MTRLEDEIRDAMFLSSQSGMDALAKRAAEVAEKYIQKFNNDLRDRLRQKFNLTEEVYDEIEYFAEDWYKENGLV